MDRIIGIKVFGNHMTKDSKNAGVRGEANITKLRIEFDKGWDGYAKDVIFWDAYGENAVKITLSVEHEEQGGTYLVPIPAEPMARAGMLTFIINGTKENQKQKSVKGELEVKDSPTIMQPIDPTPTELAQVRTELEYIKDNIHQAIEAKEDIQNMGVSAETLTHDKVAFVYKSESDGVVHLRFGLPQGKTGETGDSGVHVGEDEPTDPIKNVWINPNGSATILHGKSAYEIAVDHGFQGTEEEWLQSLKGANYNLTPADIEAIADAEDEASEKTVILTAAGWVGDYAPYTQTVYIEGITAETQGTVSISESATDEQYFAATYAMLRKTAQDANGITIKAYGDKPTIDIPLTVRIEV